MDVRQAAGEGVGPLAMIIGGGSIPIAVAEAVERRGRRVVLFPVRGWADPAVVEKFKRTGFPLPKPGFPAVTAQAEGCRDVVFVGRRSAPTASLAAHRLADTAAVAHVSCVRIAAGTII